MHEPHLTFFVELPSAELVRLFDRPEVVDFLVTQPCAVSMGLLDLTAERAAVVNQLGDAAQARAEATKKLERIKAQAKAFEGDVNRMVAAQRAIESQIIGLEAARKDIEGRGPRYCPSI